MKHMKKFLALLLCLVMILSLGLTAFAANSDDGTEGKITITNPQKKSNGNAVAYTAYKIFDVTYDLGADGPSDDKYAYTINPDWVDAVQAYVGNTPGAGGIYPEITAKGLKITPVKDKDGNLTLYTVELYEIKDDPTTPDDETVTFSAADFGEQMSKALEGMDPAPTGEKFKPGTGDTLVADELELGYYMVVPDYPTDKAPLVSLTTTDNEVSITDKNEIPEVDKKLNEQKNAIVICGKHTHTDACYTDPSEPTTPKCGKEDHTHTDSCYLYGDQILICKKSDPNDTANYEANHVHDAACYKEKDYTTKSVGDNVPFRLDTRVPDMTGYDFYFFVMNDTLTKGLTYNEDVVITIGGENQKQKTLKKDTDYSVKITPKDDGSTNIRIVFNDLKKNYWNDDPAKDWAGEPIAITYSATVDEDAEMGKTGNTNTAYIEYSHNPNIVPEYVPGTTTDEDDKNDPRDPKYKHNDTEEDWEKLMGESTEDEVTVYTTELNITKIDADKTTTTLTGAKFKIEGDKLKVAIVNKTIFEVDNTNGTWYRLKDGTYTQAKPATGTETPKVEYKASTEVTAANAVTYSEYTGDDRVHTGLYYEKTPGVYEKITDENRKSIAAGTKVYEICYNAVGLYYKDGSGACQEITEANAASHTNETAYYTKVEIKQPDLYESTTTKYKKVKVIDKDNTLGTEPYTAEGFVDKNGVITFGGLAEGIYYITELIAPDGYNLLKAPVEIDVKLVENIDTSTGEVDASKPWKFETKIGSNTVSEGTDGALSFQIENSQGTELPETGGIGTTLFITFGALVMMGAGVFFVTNQRMRKEGY